MRGKFALFFMVFPGLVPAGACAMSAPPPHQLGHCRVIGGDKLPASSGGAEAICAAIERAVSAEAPGVRFTAEVRVVTPSMLSANLVVNGRTLPDQKFAVMDRKLGEASIRRFATALAAEVAKAAGS